MNQDVVSAVFGSYSEAARAVAQLRNAGVRDDSLSIIGQQEGSTTETDGSGTAEERDGGTGGLVKGALGGAGVGALLGIAALAIPGVGPLVAAGAIAASAVPGAALTGAAIGAAAGGIAGLLTKHGVSEEDARYYEERISSGGVFVSVDTRNGEINPDSARNILYGAGGHSASRSRANVSN